ncbi:MAG: bifunctional adenosylcobinamide kinase/adenosylcobinamide-phosphate guanylyltransferase [Coriobacteriia bacterium]|nr:bifunctional adenosylcobinamide kinase/adenosylcobinamide-phosphate guanylyltransferase [Coriobacteriia bacterium]MCL2751088.1 bifunctional adenosylcobinamide kinase/adenosylcobinamide-phosphate guanylyltransferase [Coriobacteriia bacterium]
MILIIGGLGSGKHSFVAQELGYSEKDLSTDPTDSKPVLSDLQNLIRKKGALSNELKAQLLAKKVVICDEVGSGVVPLDEQERSWRDEVGRAQVSLAAEASTVIRVVCGIPQTIKGEL